MNRTLDTQKSSGGVADVLGSAVLVNATESGIWVTYEDADERRPVHLDSLRAWVVRQDDLVIGAGWYSTHPE